MNDTDFDSGRGERTSRRKHGYMPTSGGRDRRRELLPCPRCGMTAGERKESVNAVGRYFIRCAICGYTVKSDCEAIAARNWNRESREAQK